MTAVKLRIQDIIKGTFDGTSVHTYAGDVSEVRILGTLIDIFATDDDSYISLTIDDGTETIRVKAWRQDVEKLKRFSRGDLIDIAGKVREYNDEIYLVPEVVSKVSPNKWVLRELELLKSYLKSGESLSAEPALETEEESIQLPEPELAEGEEPTKEVKSEKASLKEKEEKSVKEEKSESDEPEILSEEDELGEIEEFEIFGEDEVVHTVLELLSDGMTKADLITQSGLDEIDVELALRELLDEKKIRKEGKIYKKTSEK